MTSPTLVTAGGLRIDYLVTHDGQVHAGLIGGNALYAAVGAALWRTQPGQAGPWARLGKNYPHSWPDMLQQLGLAAAGLVRIAGDQDHRTFYAYTPDGRRDDTNPAGHFERAGYPLPAALRDYIHSTPGQDDPSQYEPLALRPADWPDHFRPEAVHLAPLCLRSHLDLPPFLRRQGVKWITVDPGERYMVPELKEFLPQLLPSTDVFLPSDQEIRSLFGSEISWLAAARILGQWGAPLIIIKLGAEGILVFDRDRDEATHLRPYHHRPGDRAVVDVTGAGDAFCGGFLAGLQSTGRTLVAARWGLAAASLAIEGYGALYALGLQPNEAHRRLLALESRSAP
jgi:hypothetical protein